MRLMFPTSITHASSTGSVAHDGMTVLALVCRLSIIRQKWEKNTHTQEKKKKKHQQKTPLSTKKQMFTTQNHLRHDTTNRQ